MELEGRTVLLGVSGSIAAYKAVELASRLRKAGASVHVVMTQNATRFVSPLTFETISRNPVHVDPFAPAQWEPEHTALADRADLFVVAPATANILAKFAHGIADDLLSTLYLAARCPILVAPAMNVYMYRNPAVQENLERLRARGVKIAEPEEGMLACGYEGQGRLQEVERLVETIVQLARGLEAPRDWEGVSVLVTAGPTREPIDPVRFLSNRSSGKMGYAIAEEAALRGAQVVLVSGPTQLPSPPNVRRIQVESAEEMARAVEQTAGSAQVIFLAAAVADFTPVEVSPHKLKKGTAETWTLTLRKTPDIAASLGQRKGDRVLIGFAAETDDPIANARRKLTEKRLDLIVLNRVNEPGAGFEVDTNRVTLIFPDGTVEEWPLLDKREVARRLLSIVRDRLLVSSSPVAG
ncbi:MAG: peptidase ClpP [Candidatus Poribacteria bacterium]|nr:MAG: peptidase ClpP [Candidatus Poribacteria bacterium]